MIASLTGRLETRDEGSAVIDVGGVGYLVFASARTLDALPGAGEAVRLHVETHVREDHIHLYGFLEAEERAWFRLLTTVQGVGARVALAILSVLDPAALTMAITAQDRAALTRADGVGPRLADRILSELKNKAGGLALAAGTIAVRTPASAGIVQGAAGDAVSALVNLGYGRSEAFAAVNRALAAEGAATSAEALIRAGLRELGT